MALRKLAAVVPVAAACALAAPVAAANASAPPTASPCYPIPAYCTDQGQAAQGLQYPYTFLVPLFQQLNAGAGGAVPLPMIAAPTP
jgi:hypothetical protein